MSITIDLKKKNVYLQDVSNIFWVIGQMKELRHFTKFFTLNFTAEVTFSLMHLYALLTLENIPRWDFNTAWNLHTALSGII